MTKFKDTAALENAYKSLEAEFTRRSQKLRELERKLNNSDYERGKKDAANDILSSLCEPVIEVFAETDDHDIAAQRYIGMKLTRDKMQERINSIAEQYGLGMKEPKKQHLDSLNQFAEQLKNCFPDDDMFTERKYDKASICIAINRTLKQFTEGINE